MTLETYSRIPQYKALGRALIHFIWQGSAAGLLLVATACCGAVAGTCIENRGDGPPMTERSS